ncbi:hypothetical protein CCACVL1_02298 [Corchorus capsularis]|uniref:Uncharacterized protein n=1 Tax=Corchorus capsularis TaxID=210143 RepID=A0A1R3K9I8_COCAP|nr:hypothetical protein CCACVL1_02298 [Corchorus capsularis]
MEISYSKFKVDPTAVGDLIATAEERRMSLSEV